MTMGLLPNESFLLSSTDVRTKDRQLWQTKQKSIKSINDKVIGVLPKKKQAMFTPVEGAAAKREVDDARKGIVSAAKQMERDGAFKLEDLLGGGETIE